MGTQKKLVRGERKQEGPVDEPDPTMRSSQRQDQTKKLSAQKICGFPFLYDQLATDDHQNQWRWNINSGMGRAVYDQSWLTPVVSAMMLLLYSGRGNLRGYRTIVCNRVRDKYDTDFSKVKSKSAPRKRLDLYI